MRLDRCRIGVAVEPVACEAEASDGVVVVVVGPTGSLWWLWAVALEWLGEIGINEFLRYCSGGVGYGFSGSGFFYGGWLLCGYCGLMGWETQQWIFFFLVIFSGSFLRWCFNKSVFALIPNMTQDNQNKTKITEKIKYIT